MCPTTDGMVTTLLSTDSHDTTIDTVLVSTEELLLDFLSTSLSFDSFDEDKLFFL